MDSRLTPAVAARALGLVVLGALTVKLLARGLTYEPGAGLLNLLHLVDLVFHEAGHVIFGVFGRFIGALGGSLNQVLIPAICTAVFARQGRTASAAVALFWVGDNVIDVGIYAADGRGMRLPLLAEGLTHDWNYILSALSLRDAAAPIGRAIFVAGSLVLLASLVVLLWDLLRCWSAPAEEPTISV